jgi:hypothetical protein
MAMILNDQDVYDTPATAKDTYDSIVNFDALRLLLRNKDKEIGKLDQLIDNYETMLANYDQMIKNQQLLIEKLKEAANV